ncbi:ADOP family duplicated permease [Bryobacter aggregatus]|uniref:ADOP family duplicated permease n=1 Tax=Bryobacter aggregatus TaxID=360054 RepID=UPI0004E10DC3|nr:ADOP family duplicated permease [Bryobacter aggregatus]
MLGDLAIAFRGLRRSPLFALLAIGTLSLGIGANATIFSVVNSVLLRPLAGFETNRIMRIQDAGHTGGLGFVDPEVFKIIRAQSKTLDQLSGMQFCPFTLEHDAEREQVWGPCVTSNWFALQHAQAMLGRTFLPEEHQPGRNKVVVLEHGFWQRRFGGRRDIVGQKILLDKSPWVVIGVMPPEFQPIGASASMIFTPYILDDQSAGLYVTGRLKPDTTPDQAQTELQFLSQQLRPTLPRFQDLKLKTTSVLEDITGPAAPLLRVLLGAVSLVLLIACANVANLLLARSRTREREMKIRTALGAPRWRIVRFLFAESLLLCLAARVAALVIAIVALSLARPLTATLPRAEEVSIDLRVFAWCLATGLLTAMLFGMVPAFQGTAAMGDRSSRRWQGFLVAAELALAFVLLLGSGLLLRTFVAMRSTNLGYDPQKVLTHFMAQPPSQDGSRTAGIALYARLREKLAALPGVLDVATVSTLPMGGVTMMMDVQPVGGAASRSTRQAALVIASDGYFRVARIPMRAGRSFTPTDREGSTPVVVVSESIATRYFAGKALGQRIVVPRIGYNVTGGGELHAEIVGVIGNICVNSFSDCEVEHIYLPESQAGLRMSYFLIRSSIAPMSLSSAVQRATAEESPLIPLDPPQTLEQRTGYLTDSVRRGMWLISIFAALAAVLAASGVYGVSSYLASLRRKEMGIRVALGAGFADIASLLYSQTLAMAIFGLAAGAIAGAWLTRFIETMLFKVSPNDPVTFGVVTVMLVAVVLLAATPPALRSGGMNVAAELRRE